MPPGHRRRLEDGDGVAEQRQIVRRRKPGGAGTDHGDLLRMDHPRLFRKDVDRVARFRAMSLRQKPLQGADGNRRIEFSAPAAVSHGWPQTRPQIEAKGLGSRA